MLGSLVAVRTPPAAWHRDVVTELPDVSLQLDAVFPGADNTSRHIVSMRGPKAEDAYSHLRSNGATDRVQVLYREGGHVQLRVGVPDCPLGEALFRTGLTPSFPAPLVDDEHHLFVVGQESQLAAFVERLNRNGLPARLVRRAPALDGVQDLTHYQYDVLRRALDEGYYDRPRRATLTELAKRVGVAKSTLSETLRSVERKAVHRRLHGRHPPGSLRRLNHERTSVKNRDK